jgi:hypothetical protein
MSTTPDFMEYFGLRRMPAAMLTLLHKTKSGGVPIERLATTCGSKSVPSCRGYLVEVRAAMECEAVDFEGGLYRLTEIGHAECELAISECQKARAS